MQVPCKIHYRWASLVGFLGAYQLGYTKINNHMCSMNYETWSTITCQMSKQAWHYWNQIKLRMTETKKCDCMQLSVQKCCVVGQICKINRGTERVLDFHPQFH